MKKIITAIYIVLTSLTASADPIADMLRSVNGNNLELKTLRERLQASGSELKSENTLDATSVEYSPFFQKGASGVAVSELIVSQEFDFPTLYHSRNKAGKLQMNVLYNQYELTKRDIFQKTVETYLNYVRVERLHEYLKGRVETERRLFGLYEKKLEAGDATSLEINRIKIRLMELESDLIANEKEKAQTLAELKALNGYVDLPGLQAVYPDWAFPGQTVKEMAADDAEIKVADSMVAASLGEEKVSRQGWLPKLTLGYRRNTEFDESFNGFVVGASFPLFSQSGKLKAAKARKSAAEVEADNARKKVENEMQLAVRQLQLTENSMRAFDEKLLQEGQRLLDRSLDAGAITLTDYYTQQSEINEKLESFINLQYEYYSKLCVLYRNNLLTTISSCLN